jgi:hypothetical protein
MIPIKTFPAYTLYAGDISSFAGQTATLSFTEPAPPEIGFLNFLQLDQIIFSTGGIVPEPGSAGFLVVGALFFAHRFSRRNR